MSILTQLIKFLFGKNYQEVWRQFANENNGSFILAKDGNDDSVEIIYKDYKIIFDTYTHFIVVGSSSSEIEYTRVRAELVNMDNLKFRVFRQDFMEIIGKVFGEQDIKIGDRKFDKSFMVKGNDVQRIQYLFSDSSLSQLMIQQKDFCLELLDNKGAFDEEIQEGRSVLYYFSGKKIKSIEQLNYLYKLYVALLNQLTKLCSIKAVEVSN